MDRSRISQPINCDSLAEQIADTITIDSSQLLMFRDATDALAALLKSVEEGPSKVVAAGYVTPSVEMAVDRAGFELIEHHGASPFAADTDSVLADGLASDALIYVANPSRTVGAAYTLAELRTLAQSVPNGLLIVDEHYHEFLGISAVDLMNEHSNIAVLRSFTAGFSVGSDAGFVVGSEKLIESLRGDHGWQKMSIPLTKIVTMMLANDAVQTERLQAVYNESLRLSETMTKLGLQVRLAASDFLMFRVSDPARICNHFASNKIDIDNMHGYPGLDNYLRYEIQSYLSNDQFINALQTAPKDSLKIKKLDKRPVKMLRRSEFVAGKREVTRKETVAETSDKTEVTI